MRPAGGSSLARGGVRPRGGAHDPLVDGGPLLLLAFFAYYMPKKNQKEGDRLAERFRDQYSDFRRSVPAFVPSLVRYPQASSQRWSGAAFLANHELPMDVLIAGLFALMIIVPRFVSW